MDSEPRTRKQANAGCGRDMCAVLGIVAVWGGWIVAVAVGLLVGSGCDMKAWVVMMDDPNNVVAAVTGGRVAAGAAQFQKRAEAKPGTETGTESQGTTKPVDRKVAMFGAGCFWGVEATFRNVPGVLDTAVGYNGGWVERPTYKQVCTGRTGHAEVVRIEYDPAVIRYDQLLNVFWRCHNPTQLNRQGPDVGTQYRSVIFYFDEEQRRLAEASKQRVDHSKRHLRRVVTQIVPAGPFWRAEEYHQRYLEKRGLVQCH